MGVACLNFGTCVDGVNDYTCNCPSWAIGRHCETGNRTSDVFVSFCFKLFALLLNDFANGRIDIQHGRILNFNVEAAKREN